MKQLILLTVVLSFSNWAASARSPALNEGLVTYLGNEALLVNDATSKVLFDPFFHNGFDQYQTVPTQIRDALFSGQPPYDQINVIFVSHAHADHFDAQDFLTYLTTFPTTKLVAPQQAIDEILALRGADKIHNSLVPIQLEYKEPPITMNIGAVSFDVVRIPHAGWPQRADIANLVFRVTLEGGTTVIQMGDADPDDVHFSPLMAHWQRRSTDVAFPPYWFFISQFGPAILEQRIQAKDNVGIHVPIEVPQTLLQSGASYFSRPGEQMRLQQTQPQATQPQP